MTHNAHPLSAHIGRLGFQRDPFPVTPDEHGIFFSTRLAEQLTELLHVITQRKGFVLVTGDVGVGKSTLARTLLTRLAEQETRTALVFNTFLQGADLLRAINRDFGVPPQGESLEALLQALNTWLLQQHAQGHNCVLILDDAQGLDVPSLELVRQLSNLEASQAKLLQIVMVAQPEIRLTLNRHDMRQLASRVALRLELTPLTLRELDAYLHHRLQWAGHSNSLTVDRSAMRRLHHYTCGYIRRVHILLDRCLYGLVTYNTQRISATLVDTAARELHLHPAEKRRRGWLRPTIMAASIGLAAAAAVTQAVPPLGLSWPQPAPTTEPPSPQTAVTQHVIERSPTTSHLADKRQTEKRQAEKRLAQWQTFTAAHAPLPAIDSPPQRWPQVTQWLPERSNRQPWVPVLLSSEWPMSCTDQPLYLLAEGHLALFRTALPIQPQAFGIQNHQTAALQQALTTLTRLAPEAIDGVMGPRTAAALARFQKANGLLPSGQPDTETAYLLHCLAGDAT